MTTKTDSELAIKDARAIVDEARDGDSVTTTLRRRYGVNHERDLDHVLVRIATELGLRAQGEIGARAQIARLLECRACYELARGAAGHEAKMIGCLVHR